MHSHLIADREVFMERHWELGRLAWLT
jgi:hypothetical protein